MQADEKKEKQKQTILDLYGVDNVMKDNSTVLKLQETNLEKYGHECTLSVPEFIEKGKETCLEKYSVEYPSQSEEIKEKVKATSLEKYGATSYLKTEECKRKIIETMKKNNSFGTSKDEERIYSILKTKFPATLRQHRTPLYPFNCDFYVPELDLYIEYQGFISHGEEPYNPNNLEHVAKVQEWKELSQQRKTQTGKTYTLYDSFIKTWTITDPLKRSTALNNNLNWLEFFSEEEFLNWFNNQ